MRHPGDGGSRARPTRPEEEPLDDGPRDGPEVWRTVQGVTFCHWDRWLLRIALAEKDGLAVLVRHFRERAKGVPLFQGAAEAMLAQLRDLQSRLDQLRLGPYEILDARERSSNWLLKKAHRRVYESGPHRKTEAMRATPRVRLRARALRGHWSRFSVSPEPYAGVLARFAGQGWIDHRAVGAVSRGLEWGIDQLVDLASSDAERLAILRAALTVLIETVERADDSMGDLGQTYAEVEAKYLALLCDCGVGEAHLRDLLELAVWENYGLTSGVDTFLRTLPEPSADAAVRVLAPMIAELRREELDHHLRLALDLRRAVLECEGAGYVIAAGAAKLETVALKPVDMLGEA
ncbi:MAG: hypothetical protein IT384_18850 [Deltaproteobacteria bacterium]|nr:hypothetical protein [Deltaproteobacteria bacterium]